MDTVLLLGGIAPFCDLVEDIKETGHRVVVCDYYEDAAAKKNADFSYDISTTDIESLIQVGKKHQISGVISAFSDRNLLPNLELANRMELSTFYDKSIIELITNKIRMKEKLIKERFEVIKHKVLTSDFEDNELDEFNFPVIIKPVDSYGSKGVYVCEDIEMLRKRFTMCTNEALVHKNEIIVEDYYPYDEISISAWVRRGISYITCIYDVGKNFGEEVVLSSIVYPSKYQKNNFDKLKKLTQKAAEAFGIIEGPVTIQCFIGPSGLKVSEVLYRLAGGSPYIYPVICGGPNTARMLVDLCLNKKIDYQNLDSFTYDADKYIYDFRFVVTKPCTLLYDFNEQSIKDNVKQCVAVKIYRKNGEKIINIPKSGETVVRVFCQVNDREKEEYSELLQEVSKYVSIHDDENINVTKFIFPIKPLNNKCYKV